MRISKRYTVKEMASEPEFQDVLREVMIRFPSWTMAMCKRESARLVYWRKNPLKLSGKMITISTKSE